MAAMIYDYVVHVRVTRPDASVEEWQRPVQAYNLMEAAQAALFELDAEHGISSGGCVAKVLSVRPDATRGAETTRTLLAQAAKMASNLRAREPR